MDDKNFNCSINVQESTVMTLIKYKREMAKKGYYYYKLDLDDVINYIIDELENKRA
ncbi:hypothetical protein J3E07_001633 [Methanococcus voltae]|uniref:Uncharacterized protein n=1 Tax=Methanococcus voltae TaxID=2188 RepID=A0A8J7RHY6_METVO|nr:hypothetical protein [Methanococcus voltae]MBP2202192.1 hypothetical protein [Methanococcus voltae]